MKNKLLNIIIFFTSVIFLACNQNAVVLVDEETKTVLVEESPKTSPTMLSELIKETPSSSPENNQKGTPLTNPSTNNSITPSTINQNQNESAKPDVLTSTSSTPIPIQTTSSTPVVISSPILTVYKCSGKQYCSEMTSCEEARFYLKNCPNNKTDGDNDGKPCEDMCGH